MLTYLRTYTKGSSDNETLSRSCRHRDEAERQRARTHTQLWHSVQWTGWYLFHQLEQETFAAVHLVPCGDFFDFRRMRIRSFRMRKGAERALFDLNTNLPCCELCMRRCDSQSPVTANRNYSQLPCTWLQLINSITGSSSNWQSCLLWGKRPHCGLITSSFVNWPICSY